MRDMLFALHDVALDFDEEMGDNANPDPVEAAVGSGGNSLFISIRDSVGVDIATVCIEQVNGQVVAYVYDSYDEGGNPTATVVMVEDSRRLTQEGGYSNGEDEDGE